jgi:4-amino-4-deoxy-L-arabinose transferase-like glycosyltransferase
MTKPEIQMTNQRLTAAVLGIIALFAACQITEAFRARTLHGDETFYIQGAYTMIQSGDWITPLYETGALRLQKPILTYWIVGVPIWLFGKGLAPARIPMILLALMTALFVYGLAQVLLRDRVAALLSAAVQVSLAVVYSNAHQARTDTPIAFFVVGAIYFFARLIFEPGHERRDALLAYAATAGAVLTKGLAGPAFILLPVLVFVALRWRQIGSARWRAVASPSGLAVFVLLTGSWFALVLLRHGETFVNEFFYDQVGLRVTGGKWYILRNLVEYPWLFFRNTLPWSVPVVLGLITRDVPLWSAIQERREEWTFLLICFAVLFAIFLGANISRGRYVLTMIPSFSLLVGLLMARLGSLGIQPRGFIWGLYSLVGTAVILGLVCGGQAVVLAVNGRGVSFAELVAALTLIGGGAAMWLLVRKRLVQAAALCGGALMIFAMTSINAFLTPPAPNETIAALARDVVAEQPRDLPIASVGLDKCARAAVTAYSGRWITDWTDSENPSEQVEFASELLNRPIPRLILIEQKDYSALPADLSKELRLIATRSGTGRPEIAAWRHGRPRTLDSLIEASRVTICLLRYEGGRENRTSKNCNRP